MRGLALCLACLLATMALAGAETQPAAEEVAILSQLPKLCSNWEAATAGLPGSPWDPSTLPCGDSAAAAWRGVTCDADGQVESLALTGCGLVCSGLPGDLAQLRKLHNLDVAHNLISGGVPKDWVAPGAFAALQTLQLANNSMAGALGDFTPTAGGFIASLYFNVSRNQFNQGAIPGSWYSLTLGLIDITYNNVSGILPVEWGLPIAAHAGEYKSQLPSLARLALEGNNISGPSDPWPGGGAVAFSPDFLCTGRPGNPLMYKGPVVPPLGSGGGGLSAGAIAGIVVGSVAAAALVASLAGFLLVRRRRRRAAASPAAAAGPAGSVEDKQSGEGGGAGVAGFDFESDLEKGSVVTSDRSPHLSGTTNTNATASLTGFSNAGLLAVDTDARQLPSEWNTVAFPELEVSHTIGSGSFGTVWLAKYCQTTVAVKMLGGDKVPGATDSTHQRTVMRQLEKEAAIMSRLRHQNVCLYMGICLEPPCLLMEYCARRSVDALLSQGLKDQRAAIPLSWPRLLSMAGDAAKGMLYLHTRSPPVFHRDLKSANLLVTSQWQVKVADFSLSRALAGSSDMMSTLCTQNPRWLSPEVLAGDGGGLPADVWAFGTVMWELMTWQTPFEGVNPYQIINRVQAVQSGSGLHVPGPDQLPAGPMGQYDEYVALMQACWARDPAQRPGFGEVSARLRAMLNAERRNSGNSMTSTLGSAQMSFQPTPQLSTMPSGVFTPGGASAAPRAGSGVSGSPFESASQAASQGSQEAPAPVEGAPLPSPFAAAAAGGGTTLDRHAR